MGNRARICPNILSPCSGCGSQNSGHYQKALHPSWRCWSYNSGCCKSASLYCSIWGFCSGNRSAFNPAGGSAGKSYPVIEEPFNGGKSGVIVIGGVEYPFSNMTGHQQFKGKARKLDKTPATFIAIHNSVTSTFSGCVRVLLKKGLGVHFTIDIDGRMYQHADPCKPNYIPWLTFELSSVGIETITMYNWNKAPQSHKDAVLQNQIRFGDEQKN